MKTEILLLAALMLALGGCSRQSAQAAQGAEIYQAYCMGCHEQPPPELVTVPPKLDGLFRRGKLSGGETATDQNVRAVILHGKGIMPPFEGMLEPEQVNEVIAYLHTR